MKIKYAIPLVLVMLVLAVIADYTWAAGDYLKLLQGFSYVGWALVFVLLYLIFRNFWVALGTNLVFSAVHDFCFNLWHSISGNFQLIPMHGDAPEKIYGAWVSPLGMVWLGLKSIYFIFPVLGVILILIGIWEKRRRCGR